MINFENSSWTFFPADVKMSLTHEILQPCFLGAKNTFFKINI